MTTLKSEVYQVQRVFQQLLGTQIELRERGELFYADIDLCPLFRRFDQESRVIVVPRALTSEGTSALQRLYVQRDHSISLVFHVDSAAKPPGNLSRVIHLSLSELRTLSEIASDEPSRGARFGRFILQRIGRRSVSPYQITRPAQRRMFFNRLRELDHLEGREHFKAILGPRRIGKTSLAHALARRIAEDDARYLTLSGEQDRTLPLALISCLDLSSTTFWEEVYDRIGASEQDRAAGRRHALTDPIKRKYRRLNAYESFLSLTSSQYRNPFLILDEVDGLIDEDEGNDWAFFRQLKGWALNTSATIVFAGFRRLFYALRDDDFPFFQTCDEVLLPAFSQKDSHSLIEAPLTEMGFELDPRLPQAVFYLTGGAPALVQAIGDELATSNDPARPLGDDELRVAVRSSRTLRSAFTNFRAEATALERLVLLLYMRVACAAKLEDAERILADGDVEDGIYDLAIELAEFLKGQHIEAAKIRALLTEQLPEYHEAGLLGEVFRNALDELTLRNIFRQESQYIRYSHVSTYLLARIIADTLGTGIAAEIDEARHACLRRLEVE